MLHPANYFRIQLSAAVTGWNSGNFLSFPATLHQALNGFSITAAPTHSMHLYSSSPKSGIAFAFLSHGFQTTAFKEKVAMIYHGSKQNKRAKVSRPERERNQ